MLNLYNNAFDEMSEKMTGDRGPETDEKSLRQPSLLHNSRLEKLMVSKGIG